MNWLDIIIAIIAIYSIFKGYKSGSIKQLASLVSVVVCILLSGKISAILLPYILKTDIIPTKLAEVSAFILTFALIFGSFLLLAHMLESILNTIKLGSLNKLTGAILSFLKWMIVTSLFFNLFARLDSQQTIITQDIKTESKIFKYIQPLATEITPYLKFNLD